jgi:hypothetical protein
MPAEEPKAGPGPHVDTDSRDIKGQSEAACLLRCAWYRRHGSLDMPAEEPKPGPRPHVTSDMRNIAATALWICRLKSDIDATALWICLQKSESPVRDHI